MSASRGLGGGEAADRRELEEPLGVRLGLAGQARDLREPGADQRHRQRPLHRFVERCDQGLEVGQGEELDLVEQKNDAGVAVARRLAQGDEDVGQVVGEHAAVGQTFDRVDVEAGRQGAVGGDGERERLEHAGGAPGGVLPARLGSDVEQRPPRELGEMRAKVDLLGDLALDGRPALGLGLGAKLAQQNRLAHAAQPRDDHRLLGVAASQTSQQNVEGGELVVAARQERRPGAGVGRVGVQSGVHVTFLSVLSKFIKTG